MGDHRNVLLWAHEHGTSLGQRPREFCEPELNGEKRTLAIGGVRDHRARGLVFQKRAPDTFCKAQSCPSFLSIGYAIKISEFCISPWHPDPYFSAQRMAEAKTRSQRTSLRAELSSSALHCPSSHGQAKGHLQTSCSLISPAPRDPQTACRPSPVASFLTSRI